MKIGPQALKILKIAGADFFRDFNFVVDRYDRGVNPLLLKTCLS